MRCTHSQLSLGYLISGSNLDSSNFEAEDTSIFHLSTISSSTFEDLLRGTSSFGYFLEEEGYECVPSPTNSGPDGEAYFSGLLFIALINEQITLAWNVLERLSGIFRCQVGTTLEFTAHGTAE